MITSDEATTSPVQHTAPCSDCPWARTALAGWLGGAEIDGWLEEARGDAPTPCHTVSNQQCAGIAIFRRNQCKLPRPPALVLAANHEVVFSTPHEFSAHHDIFNQAQKG